MAVISEIQNKILLFYMCIACTVANDLAKGWGDNIDWQTLDDGLKIAKAESKPLMLVIHKSWCGACKALKPKFAESTNIQELSKDFVMVNAGDDDEPKESQYTPDGGYIPRVLFLDTEGKVRTEYYNEGGHASYKYYYPQTEDIEKSMKKVLAEMKPPSNFDEL